MKKNIMMRLASFLLVAVLISTSAISGTYAKYVTSGSASAEARVAKFGVKVSANFKDLFLNEYTTTDAWTGDDGVSVKATVDVVAPGTNGTLANFDISGEPEVDVHVTYVADFEIGDLWKVDASNNDVQSADYVRDTFYCPIIVTVNGVNGTTEINGLGYTDADAFETDVEAAIAANAEARYNAGTNLEEVEDDLNVSWKWDFDAVKSGDARNNDEYDTQLGDVAAFLTAPTVALEVSCTVTQID